MKKEALSLRPIMFVGTASDVGKSIITAGFCRIFKQDGYNPAPFKAQNMSLNSYATPEGLEIGRAQAVQAEAAGISCHTDMNPVLLKPTTDKASQVVLHGKPVGNQSAYDYFMGNNRQELFEEVKQAFDRLSKNHSPIVMEGAGSISELNLKQRDITNMRMALHAGAATYLIGDIDRGGVFGSLYGTIALLSPEEKQCIKGIIINKFRGDSRLFDEGRRMIEELCGIPVVGVLPYFKDIHIEEEDSVSLSKKFNAAVENKVNIAVILLNRMSNFTDFDRLEKDPRVNLYYTGQPEEIAKADIVILPGSKNTIEDLILIKNNGVAQAIYEVQKREKTIIGICGGYQMLGQTVEDPDQVESDIPYTSGLGLLPVLTVLRSEKTTQQLDFTYRNTTEKCRGYEIHMGISKPTAADSPVNYFPDGRTDGYCLNSKCWGTYLHGILDNPVVINDILSPYTAEMGETFDYQEYKEAQYDKLAAHIREHIDMEQIYHSLQTKK
ncbi:cobyric acid synthase [Anditalea andensis]|uniref:Cobyric acid synthase n=1 Tax=Anditalea andensis TaxID=1048983 RepID=A0A074LGN9_9BACT|nr:cobyric acid synthase [Anditalea andensis]KEO72957.1 cobalamin biosynthesis protein CobQ [Anditalea andensis]